MAIRRRKVGNSTYLEEYRSFRVNGKVKTGFVRYIGREDGGNDVKKSEKIIDRVGSAGSARAGDVDLLWALAEDLDIPGIINRMRYGESSISAGKALTAWAINRVIDPESATQLESWVKTTDIPRLSGIPEEKWTKEIFMEWRRKHPLKKKDHVAYDLTTVLFFPFFLLILTSR